MNGIRKIASREFVERVRDRGFWISTLITIILFVVGGAVGSFFGDSGDTYKVGLTGEDSAGLREAVAASADASGIQAGFEEFSDREALENAVADGDVDVGVVNGQTLLADGEPGGAGELVQSAASELRTAQVLQGAGVPPGEAQAALNPEPLAVEGVGSEEAGASASIVAIAGVTLLGLTIFTYGFWIANGVVEEKTSRVVELILATVRPFELLAGKVLGIGLLALLQLVLFGVLGIVAALIAGLDLPATTVGTVLATLVWFILGFIFYGLLFAVAGSLVSQQEDLQYTVQPMIFVLFAGFGVAFFQFGNPDALVAQVLAYIPPFTPLLMPVRMDAGLAGPLEVAITLVLMVAATAGLVALAGRLYAGSVLRFGSRVKLTEAWRSPLRTRKNS